MIHVYRALVWVLAGWVPLANALTGAPIDGPGTVGVAGM